MRQNHNLLNFDLRLTTWPAKFRILSTFTQFCFHIRIGQRSSIFLKSTSKSTKPFFVFLKFARWGYMQGASCIKIREYLFWRLVFHIMSSFRGPCCRSIIANKTKYSVEVVQSLSSLLRRSEGSDESDFLCYFHKRIDGAKFFAYSSIMQKKQLKHSCIFKHYFCRKVSILAYQSSAATLY